MTGIVFWQWDHGREHPVPVRQLLREFQKSCIEDKDKIGGLYGIMPELNVKDLEHALTHRGKSLDFYYSLNDGYELNLEYYPEKDWGFGYAKVVRQWGKTWRRVGLSMKWTEEIQI